MSKAKAPSQDTNEPADEAQDQPNDIHNQIDLNDPTLTGREAVEQNLAAQASKSDH